MAATLEPGTIIEERYEIVRVVRSGGMGAVYEARDRHLPDAPCAIKELLEAHSGEDSAAEVVRRKFQEEVRFLGRLHHPGIPRIRDFFTRGTVCYIVMDFIRGRDLEDELQMWLRLQGLPPEERVVDDVLEVLDVLEYLHGQDPPVVHRDVKPANILREEGSGRIRLVDFGLARTVRQDGSTQTAVGTLAYCPVEQLQGHAEPRSDLYALGASMVHLLTGEEPPALNVPRLAAAPREGLDPELAALVDRATRSETAQRFASATEMKEALLAWREARPEVPSRSLPVPARARRTGSGVAAAPIPEPDPAPARATTTVLIDRQSFSVGLVVFAVLFMAALATVVLVFKPREPVAATGLTEPAPVASGLAERGSAAPAPVGEGGLPTPEPSPAAVEGTPAPNPTPGGSPSGSGPPTVGEPPLGETASLVEPSSAAEPLQPTPVLAAAAPPRPAALQPPLPATPPALEPAEPLFVELSGGDSTGGDSPGVLAAAPRSPDVLRGALPLPALRDLPAGWSRVRHEGTVLVLERGGRRATLVALPGQPRYWSGLGRYVGGLLGAQAARSSAETAVFHAGARVYLARALTTPRGGHVILLAALEGAPGCPPELAAWLQGLGLPTP